MDVREALPSPHIPSALDGGLGYDDLTGPPEATIVVEVPPWGGFQDGDTLQILWGTGATIVATLLCSAADANSIVNVFVPIRAILSQGDGSHPVRARVVPTIGQSIVSEPETVLVKRSVPGGLDPHPETPFNENLTTASVLPNPVPTEATQVTITAPLWPNPATGDEMVVSWNGAHFFATALPAPPFPNTVGITLTAQQVVDAGIGPAVPVTWGVSDVVANWSGWAPEITVDVRLEDPGMLLAPHVGDKDFPWTQIDLASLGNADLPVFTPDYAAAAEGDLVTAHAHGTAFDGQTVTYDSPAQSMGPPGFGLTFTIPNSTVVALTGGLVRVWYTVQGKGDSHGVWLPVNGSAADLPAPVVTEAEGDLLDPDLANPAHVVIDYPGMAVFDTVTLIWKGTAGDGTPAYYQVVEQVGAVGPMTLPVKQTDVLAFLEGQADVYYRVVPFSRHAKTFVRALASRESIHLPLRVGALPTSVTETFESFELGWAERYETDAMSITSTIKGGLLVGEWSIENGLPYLEGRGLIPDTRFGDSGDMPLRLYLKWPCKEVVLGTLGFSDFPCNVQAFSDSGTQVARVAIQSVPDFTVVRWDGKELIREIRLVSALGAGGDISVAIDNVTLKS